MFHVDADASVVERGYIAEFVRQFPQSTLVNIADSLKVQWGSISMVMMEITLWIKLLQLDPAVDYLINLSGNDFPVQSLQALEEYLASDEVYGKTLLADFKNEPSTRWHYINLLG